MINSSSKSPYIVVVRLRSDRMMRGANIPTVFHRQQNGDRSFENHATIADTSSTSTTSTMEVAIQWKSCGQRKAASAAAVR